ncbi:MAG TPA: DUF2273 domain-containing protein [Firmicutes bacterium]|nr:DUF2273 domain-containing protein [Bacillota bacterium]
MWEKLLLEFINSHRGRLMGGLLGLILALLVLHYGFLAALFIAACVAGGYLIGRRLDEEDEGFWELLERNLLSRRDQL